LYILTDYLAYRNSISSLERDIHLLAAGLLLTTALYLAASLWFSLWGIAWLVYVLYLAFVSLAFYISEKVRKE
jgi:Na+/citrate or Na+/malate symporter